VDEVSEWRDKLGARMMEESMSKETEKEAVFFRMEGRLETKGSSVCF